MKKNKIDYQHYAKSTHAIILLSLFASLAFHIALWPAYGGLKTIVIVNVFFAYGILLQVMLLVPSWAQNILTFIFMALFIQQYLQ